MLIYFNNQGLFVRNECDQSILVVLSQLTPLHWIIIKGNDSAHISCGRVFFTVSTEFYNEATVPTQSEVALRISAITVTSVLTCGMYLYSLPCTTHSFPCTKGVIGIGVVGTLSALSSQKGAKVDGVLADGCCVVVHSKLDSVGILLPTIKSVEYID